MSENIPTETGAVGKFVKKLGSAVWDSRPIQGARDTVSDIAFNAKRSAEDTFEPVVRWSTETREKVQGLVDSASEKIDLLTYPPLSSRLPEAIVGQAKAFVYEQASTVLDKVKERKITKALEQTYQIERRMIWNEYDNTIAKAEIGLLKKQLIQPSVSGKEKIGMSKMIIELEKSLENKLENQVNKLTKSLEKPKKTEQTVVKLKNISDELKLEAKNSRELLSLLKQYAHERRINQTA